MCLLPPNIVLWPSLCWEKNVTNWTKLDLKSEIRNFLQRPIRTWSGKVTTSSLLKLSSVYWRAMESRLAQTPPEVLESVTKFLFGLSFIVCESHSSKILYETVNQLLVKITSKPWFLPFVWKLIANQGSQLMVLSADPVHTSPHLVSPWCSGTRSQKLNLPKSPK